MSSRFVRSSKYRHVFGTAAKKENTWDNIKVSKSAWDSNKVTASSKWIGVIWDAGGGGAFTVLDAAKPGKMNPMTMPLVNGHSADVLDIEFSPFNDNLIASSAEDGYAKLWVIPEGGVSGNLEAAQVLSGHKRKVGTVNFHPIADNVIATTSTDFAVKIWDIEKGTSQLDVNVHSDIIQSATWSWDGSLFGTACKDKKARVIDPRSNSVVAEAEAHQGVKGMRLAFLGDKNKLLTIGFSKTSERQYALWDPRNLGKALNTTNIDTAAGIIMPFYDNDTSVLYLAGKGDGNVRYYEIVDEDPYIYFLSEFKSASPQRGMGAVPKLAVDVSSCEITRLLKLTNTAVEPISFCVPRKSDIFQDDIYPPTASNEPGQTASGWFSGQNAPRKTISLAPGFVTPTRSSAQPKFEKAQVEEGPKGEAELRKAYEEQKKRIAFLEAELVKKDARIRELGGQ